MCDYDAVTQTIIPRNEMSDCVGGSQYVGLSEEETAQVLLEDKRKFARQEAAQVKEYLLRFQESDAKIEYQDHIARLEEHIEQATSEQEIMGEIIADIYKIYGELEDVMSRHPVLSADGADEFTFSSIDSYDKDGHIISTRLVAFCKMPFSNKLENFKAKENENLTLNVRRGDAEYPYIVHVTDNISNLSYDVYVTAVNAAEQDILDEVFYCEELLGYFDENEEIARVKAEVAQKKTEAVNAGEDTYSSVMTRLREIAFKYGEISESFEIQNVHPQDYVKGWQNTTSQGQDSQGMDTVPHAVLKIIRDSSNTDKEVLSKMQIVFKNGITYDIVESDLEGYQKLIKATKGNYTKKIYIEVIADR